MNFGKYQLKLCRYGWMLFNGPYIGKCFDLYGQYSESEVAVMRFFIRPGETVIDVGANFGDLTVPLARMVGPTGRVYACESHIDNFHTLCANIALNNFSNVKAINCFVADSDRVDTAGPWGKFGFVSEAWGTNFMPIDALGLTACSFLKVDVDGKELEVLRSARKTIETCRPILYFENDAQAASEVLLAHVIGADYDLYWHRAPIFDADNFFSNPVNHWAPKNICSLMMLAVPREKAGAYNIALRKVTRAEEWWDDLR